MDFVLAALILIAGLCAIAGVVKEEAEKIDQTPTPERMDHDHRTSNRKM